jgi:cellulose synthase/poly-beta-1,6-N-acetylglucosamine synthase-like glycosyltransferase
MLVLQVFRWLLLGVEIWIALPILYLCIVSISAILASKNRSKAHTHSKPTPINFAILIPAHNEELILGNLLESLSTLAYPKDQYAVHVVADNCTDNTAKLARAVGWVNVHERLDDVKRSKGYALSWLIQKLEENQMFYDAYVILDADSIVEPNFLQAMAAELAEGARVLQACNTVLNVTEAPSATLRWIAMTLINHVRPLGRNALGGSSTLTGNGMCLSRSTLMHHPWQAYSIAEDYQYYLSLVQQGERVRYVPEAVVRSQMPTTFTQMRTQDIRWEIANLGRENWRIALGLLRAGLRSHDMARIEAIAELLTPPLSFLVCICFITLVSSLLTWSPLEAILSFVLNIGLFFYVGTAFYFLRPPLSVYIVFLSAPGFMLWKLWVYLVLRRRKKHASVWEHTTRNA